MANQVRYKRCHWLVSPEHMRKIQSLAQRERVSASEIVRRAIEAYSPDADYDSEALAGAALDAMSRAIREARLHLADLRGENDELQSETRREREREMLREELRAHFAENPGELDALAEYLATHR